MRLRYDLLFIPNFRSRLRGFLLTASYEQLGLKDSDVLEAYEKDMAGVGKEGKKLHDRRDCGWNEWEWETYRMNSQWNNRGHR